MRNPALFAAAALAAIAAAPALAQTAAPAAGAAPATAAPAVAPTGVSVGQTVLDTAGGEVGTVSKVENNLAVIATGTHDVALPLTSFAIGDKGPVIALTRDQLNAAAEEAKAKTAAATPPATTTQQ